MGMGGSEEESYRLTPPSHGEQTTPEGSGVLGKQ